MIALASLRPLPPRLVVAIAAGLILLAVLVLRAIGHPWICTCGTVRLWFGGIHSGEDSQQFLDWYSWTHVLHGLLFYLGLWLLVRGLPLSHRWLLAILGEVGWEILENTPFIIDRYRTGTISLDYFGDSVLNSVGDVLSMIFGFWLAARLPVWASIAVGAAIEIVLLFAIRDNLTLNVIMLWFPMQALKTWQAGG